MLPLPSYPYHGRVDILDVVSDRRALQIDVARFLSVIALRSVISPRRRVGGPGLQGLVGRVPPRGDTSDAVYSSAQ